MQDIVLCKIYRKATSLKVLEQRAALEEEMKQFGSSPASPPSSTDTMSFTHEDQNIMSLPLFQDVVLKKESEAEAENEEMMLSMSMSVPKQEKSQTQLVFNDSNKSTCGGGGSSLQLPLGNDKLPELQLPMVTDWTTQLTQDTFWAHLNSPWLQNLTPSSILNFHS